MLPVFVCLSFAYLIQYSDGQNITTSPSNTAAKTGTPARLNCTADLGGDVLEWRHYLLEPSTGFRIVDSNDPDSSQDNRFELDYDGTSERYDLIIKSVNDDLAGKYVCQLIDAVDQKKEAELVALSDVTCDTLGDTDNVTIGTDLSFRCAVTYNGYQAPQLKWFQENQEITGQDKSQPASPQSLLYVANVTMTNSHFGKPFRCELNFEPLGGIGDPPVYTDSCSSDTYNLPTTTTLSTTDAVSAGRGRGEEHMLLTGGVTIFILALKTYLVRSDFIRI